MLRTTLSLILLGDPRVDAFDNKDLMSVALFFGDPSELVVMLLWSTRSCETFNESMIGDRCCWR